MNNLNKLRFNINNKNLQWFEDGILTNIGDWENSNIDTTIKEPTKKFELLKCPVNPQQTSFKYVKLPKKSLYVSEVYDIINNFYWYVSGSAPCACRLENLINVEPDNNGIIENLIKKVGNGSGNWYEALGPCIKFKQIVEEELNGFKTWRLVFEE